MRPIENLALRADREAEPTVVLFLDITHRADQAHRIHPANVVAGWVSVNGRKRVSVVVIQS